MSVIYQTSTFNFPDVATAGIVAINRAITSRLGNPTWSTRRQAGLLEALDLRAPTGPRKKWLPAAFASGMAAVSAVLSRLKAAIPSSPRKCARQYQLCRRLPCAGYAGGLGHDVSPQGWSGLRRPP
jgi:cystathionine beta-lyase/cystathionine gamma-synthase